MTRFRRREWERSQDVRRSFEIAANPEYAIEARLPAFDQCRSLQSQLTEGERWRLSVFEEEFVETLRVIGWVRTACLIYSLDDSGRIRRKLPVWDPYIQAL